MKSLIITIGIITSGLFIYDLNESPPPPPSPPLRSISPQTPIESIDYPRLTKMSKLLKEFRIGTSTSKSSYEEYTELCLQAKTPPQIGMTIIQARNSTWCFPYERHVTTTATGTYIQEVYLKRDHKGNSNSRYSDRQYLYFTNDILTAIQE